MQLKELKSGDLFRLTDKPNGTVYIKGSYVRELKKYSVTRFDDANSERFVIGEKTVVIDFEF